MAGYREGETAFPSWLILPAALLWGRGRRQGAAVAAMLVQDGVSPSHHRE